MYITIPRKITELADPSNIITLLEIELAKFFLL
jgi:hypothetical protein